jgi:hypothetical protein
MVFPASRGPAATSTTPPVARCPSPLPNNSTAWNCSPKVDFPCDPCERSHHPHYVQMVFPASRGPAATSTTPPVAPCPSPLPNNSTAWNCSPKVDFPCDPCERSHHPHYVQMVFPASRGPAATLTTPPVARCPSPLPMTLTDNYLDRLLSSNRRQEF